MIMNYDCKSLKSYKGFNIDKIKTLTITMTGSRIDVQYQVSDNDDVIDFFDSLSEAKKYIDTVLCKNSRHDGREEENEKK